MLLLLWRLGPVYPALQQELVVLLMAMHPWALLRRVRWLQQLMQLVVVWGSLMCPYSRW